MRLPVGTSPAKCARVRVPNAAGHKHQKTNHFLSFCFSQNEYYCGIEVENKDDRCSNRLRDPVHR